MGRVETLGFAPAASAPLCESRALRLVAGVGVAGDRYARGDGHWRGWPDAQLTLVEAETAQALGLPPLALRRNLVTRDVRLDPLVGRRVRVGEAVVEMVRPCDPCRYLEDLAGRAGLRARLEGRGGVRARILVGGIVRVGDAVEALD